MKQIKIKTIEEYLIAISGLTIYSVKFCDSKAIIQATRLPVYKNADDRSRNTPAGATDMIVILELDIKLYREIKQMEQLKNV